MKKITFIKPYRYLFTRPNPTDIEVGDSYEFRDDVADIYIANVIAKLYSDEPTEDLEKEIIEAKKQKLIDRLFEELKEEVVEEKPVITPQVTKVVAPEVKKKRGRKKKAN